MRATAGLLLALGALRAPAPVVPPARAAYPVTVILLDDVGYELLALAHTPHIDALAARGVAFRQAWAYPTCSPTRVALLTGRHAWRTGVGSVLGWNLPALNLGMKLEEVTLAEILPDPVDLFGKWHASHRHTGPNEQGFRHYRGCLFQVDTEGGTGWTNWVKTVDGQRDRSTTYATTDTTDDALASDAPVRLVAYHAVHEPVEPPPGGPPGTDLEVTLDMLEFLDREIGRLLEGYGGYVILLSDNGSEIQYGGGKGTLRESGIRVPFVVAGPGIEPRVADDLVSVVDVFATVAELRGVPLPDGVAQDSISLVPILHGRPGARETALVERFWPNHHPLERSSAIRDRERKLVVTEEGNWRLYRMPSEELVPKPWSPEDRAAARRLFGLLP